MHHGRKTRGGFRRAGSGDPEHFGGSVVRTGEQAGAVGEEGNIVDGPCGGKGSGQFVARGGVPEAEGAADHRGFPAGKLREGQDLPPVGRKHRILHKAASGEFTDRAPRVGGPQADGSPGVGGHEKGAIRRESDGVDGFPLAAQFEWRAVGVVGMEDAG